MRSRRTFTSDQAAAVMRLLRNRLHASRENQKAQRDQLRTKYGFWISDFWTGFTAEDFKKKVDEGTFTIT